MPNYPPRMFVAIISVQASAGGWSVPSRTPSAVMARTAWIVWTLAGNRAARAFFEALGATLVAEQPFEWDGLQLDESGYGFTNLDALLTACDEAPRTQAPASASESLH
jgi:hypothetical protein